MKFLLWCLRILPPELAHKIALNSLQLLYTINLVSKFFPIHSNHTSFVYKNLTFQNKLGIAAGLDKNGDFIDALGALGFGFIEVGTITPVAQSGNNKPRIFRFPAQKAIINRLGFNNKGVDYLVDRVKRRKYTGILGINIGANKDSVGQKRIDDFVECFNKVSPYADYITVNISSPNTPNLRALHARENFIPLFSAIKLARDTANFINPVFIKLSPDEGKNIIEDVIQAIKQYDFDGVIASNTTTDHSNLTIKISLRLKSILESKKLLWKVKAWA
ncbi:dihydroorotate dehydrogenase (quinone) [Gammaproteobacteria bacterium]|nr:dihydroorotate dehydrogenase (quinone) [Gammaproteobacteria bacterium]